MDYQLGPGPLQVDQNTIDEKIKGDIGIVENGDVATHAIPSGYYVIWKGDLYVAKTDISSGTTLSAASNGNLTAKSSGLGADVAILNSKITTLYYTGTVNSLQTSLASLASSMSVGDFQNIKYTAGETLSPFKNADIYGGTFKRTGNNFWSVMLEDPEGLPIYGTYRNGTWRWEELALNSKLSYNLVTATLNSEYIASGAINVIRVGNAAIINVSDLKFAKAFDGASSGNTITLATLPVNVKTAQVVLLQQMGSASNVRLMVESGNRITPWWNAFSITTGNGYFGSFAVILN